MTDELTAKCELLIQNLEVINKKYLLENENLCLMAGLVFTSADKEADAGKLAECKKILDKSTGILSNLRANPKMVLLSKMTVSDDPEKYLSNVINVYQKIHHGTKLENSYMTLAAIHICDLGRQDEAEDLIAKAEQITERMNKDHPFLTASEDTSFIMLLALTEKSADTILECIEEAYDYLANTCKINASPNSIQGLSEVLAISYGDTKEKCDKVMRLHNALKAKDADIGSDSEILVLGSLIDCSIDTDSLVNEIIEAEGQLSQNKRFKGEKTDKKKRLMYASMLASEVFGRQSAVMDNSVMSNILSGVIVKQISVAISITANLASAAIPKGKEADS